MRPFVVATAALAAVSVLPAQRTWVVDAAGRPGSHFRDLPAAIYSVTVVHGDRILVRPGTYSPVKITKGVRILGGPGRLLHEVLHSAMPKVLHNQAVLSRVSHCLLLV